MDKKIVFCGGGNMAEGIIRGLVKAVNPANIAVSELIPARCDYLKETYGVNATTDAEPYLKEADVIIIAVLPKFVSKVTASLAGTMKQDALLISIAAGVTLGSLAEQVGADRRIIRVMPNTLGISGHGYSAVCLNTLATAEDQAVVETVVGAIGKSIIIPEDMFNAFTAFSCSGPMWVYKTAEAMINAGVYEGFSRQDATNMVLENFLGAATVLQMTGESAASKVNAMCSPGGVTIEGFRALCDYGFDSAVMGSVNAAVNKAKSL